MGGRIPNSQPESNFPGEALRRSVQTPPVAGSALDLGGGIFTWVLATAADAITPWGLNVGRRDKELREFFPTETYLAGAVTNVCFRNGAFDWEIKGPTKVAQAVTDMLLSAIAGDTFGWVPFIEKHSADVYTQDNGGFIELIRDPGEDANSRFKGENAPVIGIAHLDAGQCRRTGDPKIPVIYVDRQGREHKMNWYEVICLSDFPSAIEKMNGVGYCAVTRALRVAQLMRSIEVFKDEKIGGRHFKQIHFVSGVTRSEIDDAMARGREEADNKGQVVFMLPAILASLDPEKPVSTATIDLANLPDGFDLDQEMKWYISGLALSFAVDYQEFAPLPGGNIGSGQQSMILHRKSSGKGPAIWMRTLAEAFKNYGVLPRNCSMRFNDKDEQEEMEKMTVVKTAAEAIAMMARNGVLDPDRIRKWLVKHEIFDQDDIEGIPDGYGEDIINPSQNPVGQIGGNTVAEDVRRTPGAGAPSETAGARLRKMLQDLANVGKNKR